MNFGCVINKSSFYAFFYVAVQFVFNYELNQLTPKTFNEANLHKLIGASDGQRMGSYL